MKNENIENVVLTGRRSDVEQIIAASDVGLLCTFSEGISNSIIEYMALGKPVIVTDLKGGSKELVINGETGFCTERDILKVVDLINELIDDQVLRNSMGKKGKERITRFFSIKRMGEEFVDLYHNFD